MLREFPMTQNDLLPELATTLEDADGTPLDLTGMTVKFVMVPASWQPGDPQKINRTATVVDAATGRVKYSWQAGDTDTAGTGENSFRAQFKVTSGSLVFSVPNLDYIFVPIIPDMATPAVP